MKQIIKCDENKKIRIDEGQEKGNNRNIITPRPAVQPAPQPTPQPTPQEPIKKD